MSASPSPEQRFAEQARLEHQAAELLCDIGTELIARTSTVQSIQLMRDQDLHRIRDREENDLRAFFEVAGGTIYHLRAYLCHMLARRRAEGVDSAAEFEGIHLTAYRKTAVAKHGGTHALKQDVYPWNAEEIVSAIVAQNADLFALRTTSPPARAEETGHTAE